MLNHGLDQRPDQAQQTRLTQQPLPHGASLNKKQTCTCIDKKYILYYFQLFFTYCLCSTKIMREKKIVTNH